MKTITLSITAWLALTALQSAHAANAEATAQSLTVQVDGLNLNTHRDAVTMYDRLHLAAKRVCVTQRGVSLRERQAYVACVDRAVRAAVAKLDRPVLSRYAAEHSDRPIAEQRIAADR